MTWNNNYQSGRGIDLRFIIGLVIAVGGLISYFAHTQKNPVTGEKQHISLSVDDEKALGLQAAPQMAAQMGGAVDPKTDAEAAEVAKIGGELVARTDASSSPYVGNFHYTLLNDTNTINAFALPGGQIFITRALYEKLKDESELAGVLGHETGHVIERHSAQQMAKGQLGGTLSTAVAVGASNRNNGYMAAMAAQLVNQMTQLHFSRDDEREADEFGFKYMAQAGYDPRGMEDVMHVLIEASKGSHPPEMLATHPNPDKRLADIQAMVQAIYPNGVPRNLSRGAALPRAGQTPAEPRDRW